MRGLRGGGSGVPDSQDDSLGRARLNRENNAPWRVESRGRVALIGGVPFGDKS
jgi:hypothetical protein